MTVENYYYKVDMCKICPWRGVGGGYGEVDGEVIPICLVVSYAICVDNPSLIQ